MQLADLQNTLFKFTKIRVESFNSHVYFLLDSFFLISSCDLDAMLLLVEGADNLAKFNYSLDTADIGTSSSGSEDCVKLKLSHPALIPCHKPTISASETAI